MSVFMRPCSALAALLALGTVTVSHAQVTAPPNIVNFQGRLATPSGNPVPDGTYNIRFRFYDAATGGNTVHDQSLTNVAVKNGVIAILIGGFTADKFNGNTWLGISINGGNDLAPRAQIVSVPYALKSNLALTVPDGSLTAAKFASGVLNSNVWLLSGNSGTTTSHFLGTTDNNPLELRVNGRRAMHYSYAENTATAGSEFRSINVLGGSEINAIAAGVVGATIAGGGHDRFTGSDAFNRINADFGTIGGGLNNAVNGFASFVGGGSSNSANGQYATIGSGSGNDTLDEYATVGGGRGNTASAARSTVGGGSGNTASGYASTIGGGGGNYASGGYSTIGGGFENTATGSHSTVAGGYQNTASGYNSMAAGGRAKARHNGAFVWADNTLDDFASTAANQFLIRAAGGVGINTAIPGGAMLRVKNASNIVGICAGDLAPVGAASFESNRVTNTSTYHLVLCNDGTDVFYVNGSGRPFGTGSYATISDARYKRNVTTLENALDTILNLRGVTYEWDTEKWKERGLPAGKQIGFIAQEVEKILPELVTTDAKGYKSVSYADAVPVLVEAVKMQNKKVETLSKENAELKAKNDKLEARLDAIERALAELKANK